MRTTADLLADLDTAVGMKDSMAVTSQNIGTMQALCAEAATAIRGQRPAPNHAKEALANLLEGLAKDLRNSRTG